MSNNNNKAPSAPGNNFTLPQQMQMMAPPQQQLPQQQRAAWMGNPGTTGNTGQAMNMNIANMNPQQQQALVALQQQMMFRNNVHQNHANNTNLTAANVSVAAVTNHRPPAVVTNSNNVTVNSAVAGSSASTNNTQQQQQQQRRGSSSSINPMNLTPKEQQQLQHHQKSQMIHLQQQLNAQKPSPMMAAMAAAAAAASGGNAQQGQVSGGYVSSNTGQQQQQQQQQQQWGGNQVQQQQQQQSLPQGGNGGQRVMYSAPSPALTNNSVTGGGVSSSSSVSNNVRNQVQQQLQLKQVQQQQQQQQQQHGRQLQNQRSLQQQNQLSLQQQQQQMIMNQTQQQQMNQSQQQSMKQQLQLNQSQQQQQQQQQQQTLSNQNQQSLKQQLQLKQQQQSLKQQLQLNQSQQQQMSQNQQSLKQQLQLNKNQQSLQQQQQQMMMRHKAQQEQLKQFQMQAVAQSGQQVVQNVQQQRQAQQQQQQQSQQQLPMQSSQQQSLMQQLKAFQDQRMRMLQGQQQQQQGQSQQNQSRSQQGQSIQQGQVFSQNAQHGLVKQNSQQMPQQPIQQQQQQLNVQLSNMRRPSMQADAASINPQSHPPPSLRRNSVSPLRPPSVQPASRQSFTMSASDPQGQMLMQPDSRHLDFYKPLKASKANSRGSTSSNGFTAQEVDAAAATSVQMGMGGRSSSMNSYSSHNIETSTVSQTNQPLNPNILHQYQPMMKPTLNNTVPPPASTNVEQRRPSQSQKSTPATAAPSAAPAPSSGKSSTSRQQPHESTLTYEEVGNLAKQLSCAEKVVWVSKQVLGTHGSNGFQKSMSNVQRAKRQRLRQYKNQRKDDTKIDRDDLEVVKAKTFNARTAEKMIGEMNQGLKFCDLMADTIKGILKEIDPNNPLIAVDTSTANPSLLDAHHNPKVAEAMAAMHAISSTMNPSLREPTNSASRESGHNAETAAQGNPHGSTLRKLRRRSSVKVHADRDLLALIGDRDDNGKKLTQKELGGRLFEATRFRTLTEGDFVAAKVSVQPFWILARVARQWDAVDVSLKTILDMPDNKREALFKEKVFIQVNDDNTGDASTTRAVKRQHILPLARSFMEGNEWGKRLRKGSRVYAIYPKTIMFYSATVVDCSTFCRNQDDIIVVEFDSESEGGGNAIPKHHIPARFVTLVPREFETNKRKRRSTTDTTRRRSSKVVAAPSNPPVVHQRENFAEMLFDPSQR